MHHMADHHVPIDHEYMATHCLCGDAMNSSLHEQPPCAWCSDGNELGTPSPWWSAVWCRLCAWLFVAK